MTDNQELDAAVNTLQNVEREEDQVATTNDQILELEAAIADSESNIEKWLDCIRSTRRTIRQMKKKQDLLRAQRTIFAKAAWDLKQVMEP